MDKYEVLATVGGREITRKDIEALLKNLDPQTAAQFNSEEGRKTLIQELVNQELFYLDAVANKLDEEEAYKSELERVKVSTLKQYAMSKLLSTITINDDELLNYYNRNINQFAGSKSVKASHILVDTVDKAIEILNEIDKGSSFEEAASKYSKCPSKSQGGDLGYFTRGHMVPEFEDAAFNMEKGEISQPVKTQFGYHIIKVTDIKEASTLSFDEVKGQLTRQLLGAKQQNVYYAKISDLKQKYEVKINQ